MTSICMWAVRALSTLAKKNLQKCCSFSHTCVGFHMAHLLCRQYMCSSLRNIYVLLTITYVFFSQSNTYVSSLSIVSCHVCIYLLLSRIYQIRMYPSNTYVSSLSILSCHVFIFSCHVCIYQIRMYLVFSTHMRGFLCASTRHLLSRQRMCSSLHNKGVLFSIRFVFLS